MKLGKIKSIKEGYDKMYTFTLDDGTTWISHKCEYIVGETVKVIPFMGAVKIEKVSTNN